MENISGCALLLGLFSGVLKSLLPRVLLPVPMPGGHFWLSLPCLTCVPTKTFLRC